MKKNILLIVAMIMLALSSVAHAINVGADQLLGTIVPGVPGNPDNEQIMVNGLLEGWGSVLGYNDGALSGTVMGDNPNDPNDATYTLRYSTFTAVPSAGSAPLAMSPDQVFVTGDTAVNLGNNTYDWIVAKWGSDTAVYYIGGLPVQFTLTLDGTGWSSEGHGLSGYSLFNRRSIPDGGTTVLLLGVGLLGLAFFLKRLLQ